MLTFVEKMEISIKEENLTVTKMIVTETASEAVEAAYDIISRIFGELATEKAFKQHQKDAVIVL